MSDHEKLREGQSLSHSSERHSTPMTDDQRGPNPMWGGRFEGGGSDLLTRINSTVHFDWRLLLQDIQGSIAHARMLGQQNIIEPVDADIIIGGLKAIRAEAEAGTLRLDPELEDVHMNVEARLSELIGPVAGNLHIGRSRNDQVVLDTRMWTLEAIGRIDVALDGLIEQLAIRALEHADDAMPGFTHLQVAQPVTIGHHLLAYAQMFLRDRHRFVCVRNRTDVSPLGAAALAGTSHSIDPSAVAADLGFSGLFANSIDAVSDRDFIIDYLAAGAQLAVHLSRLGEEIVIWASRQFGFVTVSEGLSAGSSIMPQKCNPDVAELIRGKAGRVIGSLIGLLTVLKGLPLAYSRDLQEDKEALFDAADTLELCTEAAMRLTEGMRFDVVRMRAEAAEGNSLATDLADWLVTERSLTFRSAHHTVGLVVKTLAQRGLELSDVDTDELASIEPLFGGATAELLSVENAIRRRRSPGGTSPENVRVAAERLREASARYRQCPTALFDECEGGPTR
ncbi:argininosuccinate lyase [Mycolicibacterium sp. YH-1]|uniref:argininosuccinate lyase n=1 Tax=Mycolicibacterium sp. YH-1 TaxID=2908837 RepID=UPI001F4C366D|nr:argininosuccinate lyase [Mycolicibacterium sp. YH-1]UNB54584.1 argininosuccinate lyase [Mycolicibacterium sp. YH-1]